jgi:hypothetical protein
LGLFQTVKRYVRKREGKLLRRGGNMWRVLVLEWGIVESGGGGLRNHHYLLMVLDSPIQEIDLF